MNQTVQEV